MKPTKLFIVTLISLFLIVLSACTNDTPQSQNASEDNYSASSIKTDQPSQNNANTRDVRYQRNNNEGDFPFGLFGFRGDNQNQQRQELRKRQNQDRQNRQQSILEDRNQQENQTDSRDQGDQKTKQSLNEYASTVIKLTNKKRRNQGLSELQVSQKLSRVAQKKSQNMQNKSYFSHTSPTYGSPFEMMDSFGVTYQSAGENIARGQQSPQEVVDEWMNSPEHRENILNGDFTHIGIGYAANGNYWTQMFIQK